VSRSSLAAKVVPDEQGPGDIEGNEFVIATGDDDLSD
jgi:hypothetical protein